MAGENYMHEGSNTLEKLPVTLLEISSIVSDTEDKLLAAHINKRWPGDAQVGENNRIMEAMARRLFAEKDQFGRIFKTENGSIYFVLQSGESLRIKKEKRDIKVTHSDDASPQDGMEVQTIAPIMRKSFLIGTEEKKEFLT